MTQVTLVTALLAAIIGAIVGLAIVLTAIWVTLGRISGPILKPQNPGVREPVDPEQAVKVRISETAISRIADYIAAEGGVSPERARADAERAVAEMQTRGDGAW